MDSNEFKVCIVIVNWNTVEHLRICLESIFKKIIGISLQVLVIDNASEDNSTQMVEREFKAVELIKNSTNVGFGAAINQVINQVNAEYVLLLNSDTRVVDTDIAKLIAILDDDPTIGIASGKMCNMLGEPMPSYYEFPSFWYLIKANTFNLVRKTGTGIRGKMRKCVTQNDFQICEVDWVSGGYLLIRRDLLGNGPIFDPRLFMFYEDALLCRKVWGLGKRVVYIPLAEVYHEQGGSTKKRLAKSMLASFKSSRIYVQEIYGNASLVRYDFIVRTSWQFIKLIMQFLRLTGLSSQAHKKVEQFQYLIKNTSQL